jgi:hypothetical protein
MAADAMVQAFGARLASFHALLSPDEQRLLEALMLMADQGSGQDTGGFTTVPAIGSSPFEPWVWAPGAARALAQMATA